MSLGREFNNKDAYTCVFVSVCEFLSLSECLVYTTVQVILWEYCVF